MKAVELFFEKNWRSRSVRVPENNLRLFLESNDPNLSSYNPLNHSCTTTCEDAFEFIGVLPVGAGEVVTDYAGNLLQVAGNESVTPKGLRNQLKKHGVIGEPLVSGTSNSKIEFWKKLLKYVGKKAIEKYILRKEEE